MQLLPLPEHWLAEGVKSTLISVSITESSLASISQLPDYTWLSALSALPVLACFLIALLFQQTQISQITRIWVITAFAQALLGLLQLSFPDLSFGAPSNIAQGSFGSKNSFANYLAMVLPSALLLTFGDASSDIRVSKALQHRWFWAIVLLLLLSALVASGSRAGISTGVFALVLTWTLIPMRGEYMQHYPNIFSSALRFSPLVLVGIAMAAGGWGWLYRFEVGDPARLLNWTATWEAIQALWPLGSGLGTFSAIFPRFQSPELGRWFVNFAHNDYLQLLMECGVLVIPVALALLWLVACRSAQLVRARHRGPLTSSDSLAMACGLGFLAQALHAWVDYPWRIPATAMLGAFLLGVFLRQPEGVSAPRHAA